MDFDIREDLNLDTLTHGQLTNLVNDGYLARRWGAVWGMKPSEYWALTANGEELFRLV